MANGDALKKRYTITDVETGEEVEGWVLRPKSDSFARSAMFAYTRLCGIDAPHNRAIGLRDSCKPELLKVFLDNARETGFIASNSFPGDLEEMATLGAGGDGSVRSLKLLLEGYGQEPILLICGEFDRKPVKSRVRMHQAKEARLDIQRDLDEANGFNVHRNTDPFIVSRKVAEEVFAEAQRGIDGLRQKALAQDVGA